VARPETQRVWQETENESVKGVFHGAGKPVNDTNNGM